MDLTRLPWLPRPPEDFRARCRALTAEDGEAMRFLAGHALDLNQLNSLAKAIRRAAADGPIAGLAPLRLALLSNGTTSLLVPALVASAARHGLLLDVIEAPYDQAMQAALDSGSDINRAAPDVALLAFDQRLVRAPSDMADRQEADAAVTDAIGQLETIRNGIASACGATAVYQTLPPPPARLLGSYEIRLPGSRHALAAEFNRRLVERIDGSGDLLLDASGLAETVGLDSWHDATQWHIAKLAFSQAIVPLYADHVARLLAAMRGRSRKCLVLDLDNTLWGGVIGDDGIGGIVLGQGDPVGEAYLDIQQTALQLRSLGIVLAVSSKNDDATARLPFRDHPDMLLGESDIAVFQANWSDKATNLEAIAKALDIGIDSLVFLDDNPAERAQVRQALPSVAVPELPDDPAQFVRALLAAGYFETLNLSQEDLLRADDYAARAKRVELQSQARDLVSYLESLDMEIVFAPFDETGRSRIAQLINKSNQFNLTTRRYTESEVAAMEADPTVFTLQVRLRDRFGDNGMISVIVCRADGEAWDIDTWLMSCRVLGRRVEEAVLAEIASCARVAGAAALVGQFIPSGRNELVRNHFAKLGFSAADEDGLWRLDLGAYRAPELPMRVIRGSQKIEA